MKDLLKLVFCTMCLLYAGTLFAQNVPDWMDSDIRAMQYPSKKYLVGYASGNINGNEDIGKGTERIKNAAQSNLLESIRVNMKSNTRSAITAENVNGQYYENEAFVNATEKKSVAEIVGMKTESYYDKKSKTVYAFAYAKRDEVIAYHKNLLMSNLSQAEGLLNTAQKLATQKDRSAAREECAKALAVFEKINESQSLLLAVNSQISEADIQQNRSKNLYKDLLQMQSQLDPKYEILENLQNNLSQKLIQVESFLQTSKNLVSDGEKAKARSQCELAKKILNDVRKIQDSMRMTEPAVSTETLQQTRTENLHNEINLLSAQLAQAVMVYVESSEDVFGKQVNVIANKLKSQMAENGCSFTEDESKADFKLTLNAETREGSATENLVFCYADISIDLFDTHKQKSVFSDDLSEKGGSTTKEKAARKAMENAVNKIMNSIVKWIK